MDGISRTTRRAVMQFNLTNASSLKVSSSVRLHSSSSGKKLLAARDILRSEMLAVYSGKRSNEPPGDQRNRFIYGIEHEKKYIWINAEHENNIIKFIRNEKKGCNTRVKKVLLEGIPYPLFEASRFIQKGEELIAFFGTEEHQNLQELEVAKMVDRPRLGYKRVERPAVVKSDVEPEVSREVNEASPTLVALADDQASQDKTANSTTDEEKYWRRIKGIRQSKTTGTESEHSADVECHVEPQESFEEHEIGSPPPHIELPDDQASEENTVKQTDEYKHFHTRKIVRESKRDDSIELEHPADVECHVEPQESPKEHEVGTPPSHVELQDDTASQHIATKINVAKKPEVSKRKPRRPLRPCLFCSKLNSRLPRHYETIHADEPEIQRIQKMTPKKRPNAYALLRIEGIYKYNIRELGKESPHLLTERKLTPSKKIMSCATCKKFIQARTFYAHACSKKTSKHSAIPVECMTSEENAQKFHMEIIKALRNDEVGEFAKNNDDVKLFGLRLFRKVKNPEKKTEQRHAVMAHMRKLTKIYFEFRSAAALAGKKLDVIDMFYSKNYTYLEAAFETIGGNSFGTKRSNARLEHCGTFLKAIKKLKAVYFIRQDAEKVAALTSFGEFFKSERNDLFGEDEEVVFKQRELKLRQPKNLPLEEQVGKLRNHCVARTDEVMRIKGNSKEKYLELRRLVVCRLTFLNGRRGGEPARLLLDQMQMAIDGVWLAGPDYDRVRAMNTRYKELLDIYMLAYQTGKRNSSWVPVLVPRSSLPSIRYLMDTTNRRAAGIDDNNPFLFAMTGSSESHAVGSTESRHICNEIGVNADLTATGNRHRVSTVFATKDVPESDRETFFRHMGHSGKINREVYQAPSIRNVMVSGDHLHSMDQFSFGSETLKPSTSRQAKASPATKKKKTTRRQLLVLSSDDDTTSSVTSSDDDGNSTGISLVAQKKLKTSRRFPRPESQVNPPTPEILNQAKSSQALIYSGHSTCRQLFARSPSDDAGSGKDTEIDMVHEASCDASDANDSDTEPSESFSPCKKRKLDLQPLVPRRKLKKKLQRRIKWSSEDNKLIETAFNRFIGISGDGGKGQLPGKSMIDEFMRKTKIAAVGHLTPRKKYRAIRTQIFNLRIMARKKVGKRMAILTKKP